VFIGYVETLPEIIAFDLHKEHESKLLSVLREHKEAIGWSLADIKGLVLIWLCIESIWRKIQKILANHNGDWIL